MEFALIEALKNAVLSPIFQRCAQTLSRTPSAVTVSLVGPPPPVHAAENATPQNRQLAEIIDALDKLNDSELIKRRSEAAIAATGPVSGDQQLQLLTLEGIEFLARRRGLGSHSNRTGAYTAGADPPRDG